MAFEKQLDELKHREALADKMGGEEKLARQYSRGKLDVRERMRRLLDDGSFREIGKIAGKGNYDAKGDMIDFSPSNFIFGRGRINNAPIVATADDFTVRGGAGDASIHRKFIMAERMAHEMKMPIVRMIDGTGGGGSIKALDDLGFTYVPFIPLWADVVKNLKTVPVVALALGPTAGLGAARMVASHYSIMVRGVAQIFTAGPAVVAGMGAGSEALDKEALGGADIHARNGVIDDEAESEDEAFAMARAFLSFLPPHVGAPAPRVETYDSPERRDESLSSAVPENPKHAYNMRRIVETVADQGSVFEIGRRWGRAAITAFARLDGYPVAILAGDPTFLGGSWTAGTAEKVKRFIQLAEQFRIPVVHLVDNPGFMIGLEAEKAATIRRGVETLNAVYETTVPWATIIVRNAFGVAGAAMSDDTRFQYRFAWPSGDWGSLPMAGGVEVAYKSELEKAEDPAAELEAIKSRLSKITSPFRTAEQFLIEDIIDPRETRPLLCEFAQLAQRNL